MAYNITGVAEPGEARLPSALARGRAPQARLSRAEERSGYALLSAVQRPTIGCRRQDGGGIAISCVFFFINSK